MSPQDGLSLCPELGPFFDSRWRAPVRWPGLPGTRPRKIPDSPATFLVDAKRARDSLFASSFQRRRKRAKTHQRPFLSHPGALRNAQKGDNPIIDCSRFVTLPKNRNATACPDAKRFVRSFGQLIDLYCIGAILLGSPIFQPVNKGFLAVFGSVLYVSFVLQAAAERLQ
jgi:hypothetical protein